MRKLYNIKHIVIHSRNGGGRKVFSDINLNTMDIELIRRFIAFKYKVKKSEVFLKGISCRQAIVLPPKLHGGATIIDIPLGQY